MSKINPKLDIDFDALREQKQILLKEVDSQHPIFADALDGIIHLIDAIQDHAVDEEGFSELEVFGVDVQEWFYDHDNEWQNDMENAFYSDTKTKESDHILWAFKKYH